MEIDKERLKNAFIDSCPYHNIKNGHCYAYNNIVPCNGDCEYCKKFMGIIDEIYKNS